MPLKLSRRMLGLTHPPLRPVSSLVTLVVSLNLAEPQLPLLQNRDNSCLPRQCLYRERLRHSR